MTIQFKKKSSDIFPGEASIFSIKNDKDEHTGYMGLIRDISERMRMETLQSAKKSAEEANRAKSEFLANMSHELRTPLNAVLGFSQILKNQEKDPRKSHFLDTIHTSGRVLMSLINDVLDLSKIEAGKLTLEYSACDLADFMNEMRHLFAEKARNKDLMFITTLDSRLPGSLVMDQTRLRQICINLLSNAIKYTQEGRVAFEIMVDPDDGVTQSAVDLIIRVSDTGKGIASQKQQIIFDAFVQLKKRDRSAGEGGTGLGLTITRNLVHPMGGWIDVQSRQGMGACFTVHLPGLEVAATSNGTQNGNQSFDADKIDFDPATLIVADDIDYNREMLMVFLEAYDFTFVESENGRDTIALAEKINPEAILLDMKMPVMNGYETSELMKKNDRLKNIPIIAITADALKQDEERISRLCDGYLRKPVTKPDLVMALMQLLPHRIKPQSAAPPAEEKEHTAKDLEPLLAGVSPELRQTIVHVAQIGHSAGVIKCLNQMPGHSPDLVELLRKKAEDYDFEWIINLLAGKPR